MGGAMGVVAILIKQELLLLFIAGVFVIELLSVILQVGSYKLRQKRIFKMAPIHHHFEALGWPESKIIARFWIAGLVLALFALTTLETPMKLGSHQSAGSGHGEVGPGLRCLSARSRRRCHHHGHQAAKHAGLSSAVRRALRRSIGISSFFLPVCQPISNLCRKARARGIDVIGEIELAAPFLRGRTIGITGSNGKTTTTSLVGHILHSAGVPAQVGGNIGTPVIAMTEDSRDDQWNVLELSSFQLETARTFRAHIAVCLNVTQNHLDRHRTMENYIAAEG